MNPPPRTTSSEAAHEHKYNPPYSTTTVADDHNHMWSHFSGLDQSWNTFNQLGNSYEMIDWGDGLDTAGSGTYMPAWTAYTTTVNFYTDERGGHDHAFDIPEGSTYSGDPHSHSVDIPVFNTSTAGSHTHSVDIPNTSSTTASTSDVMPYIQFLVCEKD